MNFSATIEFTNKGEAIVALFDSTGEWSGAERLTLKSSVSKADLYEAGYRLASANAANKGGRLDRYRLADAIQCAARLAPAPERRRANALNVEIGAPSPRCTFKAPEHWPDGMVGRWLRSGGSPLVLGHCSADCPLDRDLRVTTPAPASLDNSLKSASVAFRGAVEGER